MMLFVYLECIERISESVLHRFVSGVVAAEFCYLLLAKFDDFRII